MSRTELHTARRRRNPKTLATTRAVCNPPPNTENAVPRSTVYNGGMIGPHVAV